MAQTVQTLGGAGAAAKNIADAAQSANAAGLTQPGGLVGPPTRQ